MTTQCVPVSDLCPFSIAKVRREGARWLCLREIDFVRPVEQTGTGLMSSLWATYPDLTTRELSRELDYLEKAGLLTIGNRSNMSDLKLTRHGIDLVEYTVECPPGIARPPHSEN